MRNHVARILKKPVRERKMMSLSLDREQMELVEKLSLFFSRETQRGFSKNQVVEEAVRAFVKESADYIAEEFDMDIREIPLTEMQQYKRVCTVDIGVLDTVVLPIRDEDICRCQVFERSCWTPLQLDRDKLTNMKYAAFYFCTPTCAITHFARIKEFTPVADDPRKHVLHFDSMEELGKRIEWAQPTAGRLRRPRYTVFSLLLEAKTMEELF